MKLFDVTEDTFWLDKILDHFDRLLANAVDHDGDGYFGWPTERYSAAHLKVVEARSAGARLIPTEIKIIDRVEARKVTGHKYEVYFDEDDFLRVTDLDTGAVVYNTRPTGRRPLVPISGVDFRIEDPLQAGDSWVVATTAQAPLEYLIHEGMVWYPIALFIERVLTDPALQVEYGAWASRYLMLMLTNFEPKWRPYWVELSNGGGAYRFTDRAAESYPGRILPHDQYAMHAQTYMVLDAIVGVPEMRDKAVMMARNFQNNLRSTEIGWVWNNWDWGDGPKGNNGVEDSRHAALNISMVIEAYHRGLVFDRQDLVRFSNTLVHTMWNGSLSAPNVGDAVNRAEGNRHFPLLSWVDLREFDPMVWNISLSLFRSWGEPAKLVPAMLYAQEGSLARRPCLTEGPGGCWR